jgi:hypothetical protein
MFSRVACESKAYVSSRFKGVADDDRWHLMAVRGFSGTRLAIPERMLAATPLSGVA